MALVNLAVLLLALGTSSSAEQGRRKVFVCEGSELSLSCPPGTSLHPIRANYGRFSQGVCPGPAARPPAAWSTRCLQPTSLRQLTARCGGRPACRLTVSSGLFGDPCPGTPKYLQLLYTCRDAGEASTPSPLLPPWMVALESMRESVVLGPRTTTTPTTTTSTSTSPPPSTSRPPLRRTAEEVRRPSLEFLRFIQRKEQQRRRESALLNSARARPPAAAEGEAEGGTVLIAASASVLGCSLLLGLAAALACRRRRAAKQTDQNNVYQISSASSTPATDYSSYLQYSSSSSSASSSSSSPATPATDYSYMLGSDGRTYRTVTPLPRGCLPPGSQPVPVLQAWGPDQGDELYVDIDRQEGGQPGHRHQPHGAQYPHQTLQYQPQTAQYLPQAAQYLPQASQYQPQALPSSHLQHKPIPSPFYFTTSQQ